MGNIRVAVIRGGTGGTYKASLETGKEILRSLPRDVYEPLDILIDRDGVWHAKGVPVSAEQVSRMADVVFNALHGEYGEDGALARDMKHFGVPTTGTNPLGGSLSFNKVALKNRLAPFGIKSPRGVVIERIDAHALAGFEDGYIVDAAKRVFREIAPPWIVKPARAGALEHVHVAHTFDELVLVLSHFKETEHDVLVEEFVHGKEFVLGGIQGFRNDPSYKLVPMWVKRPRKVVGQELMHKTDYEPIHPKDLSANERELLSEYIDLVRREVDPGDYFTIDGILSPRGIVLLEVNSQPALHEHAPFPSKLAAVGATMPEFLDHVIKRAMGRK